jgi:DNA-binding transcriptional LysR family regulator
MTPLDIPSVQAFLLIAEFQSFTRAAEASGTTQAAVSMKLQRLEALLGKRLVERSPRAVRLTADGMAFRENARALMDAHDRALNGTRTVRQRLSLGVSDHAAGPELPAIMSRLAAIAPALTIEVSIGFSRNLLDTFDAGELDAVIVRQEGSRRGGETLAEDRFGWFAAPSFTWEQSEPLRLATLGAPCAVRAMTVRALDKAGIRWTENFVGGGVTALAAAAEAGLGIAPMALRIAPRGLVEIGAAYRLPNLGRSKVMLYSKIGDAARLAALRTVAAAFRGAASKI